MNTFIQKILSVQHVPGGRRYSGALLGHKSTSVVPNWLDLPSHETPTKPLDVYGCHSVGGDGNGHLVHRGWEAAKYHTMDTGQPPAKSDVV